MFENAEQKASFRLHLEPNFQAADLGAQQNPTQHAFMRVQDIETTRASRESHVQTHETSSLPHQA